MEKQVGRCPSYTHTHDLGHFTKNSKRFPNAFGNPARPPRRPHSAPEPVPGGEGGCPLPMFPSSQGAKSQLEAFDTARSCRRYSAGLPVPVRCAQYSLIRETPPGWAPPVAAESAASAGGG